MVPSGRRKGNASAQYNLALMYHDGRGVPQNHAEAVRLFRRAAEQNHALAQSWLGLMYERGQGVPTNNAEAVKWYQRAAEQGDVYAQLNLGFMYYEGHGVSQNYAEAAQLFRPAAEQGEADAQLRLGFMYYKGQGVTQDDVQAHKWYNLAASNFQPSSEAWEAAVSGREWIAARLSPAQLAHAQRLAREWRPSHHTDSPSPAPSPRSAEMTNSAPREPLEQAMTGSGFRVTANGHVLTNAHVVRGCAEVRVLPATSVRVLAYDDASDLALLDVPSSSGTVAMFRQGRGIRSGASVTVLGYPLRGIVSSETSVSAGVVSALAGPGDDRRMMQITAPVQPGNSGGPALDSAGNVVGVVVSKLNALEIARSTGDIPQNVNFAVAAGAVRAFLDAEGVPYLTAPSDTPLAPDQVAALGKGFTVLVECWKPRT